MAPGIERAVTKLVRHGNSHAILIHAPVLDRIGWRAGDVIHIAIRGNHIIAQKVELPRVPVLSLDPDEVAR